MGVSWRRRCSCGGRCARARARGRRAHNSTRSDSIRLDEREGSETSGRKLSDASGRKLSVRNSKLREQLANDIMAALEQEAKHSNPMTRSGTAPPKLINAPTALFARAAKEAQTDVAAFVIADGEVSDAFSRDHTACVPSRVALCAACVLCASMTAAEQTRLGCLEMPLPYAALWIPFVQVHFADASVLMAELSRALDRNVLIGFDEETVNAISFCGAAIVLLTKDLITNPHCVAEMYEVWDVVEPNWRPSRPCSAFYLSSLAVLLSDAQCCPLPDAWQAIVMGLPFFTVLLDNGGYDFEDTRRRLSSNMSTWGGAWAGAQSCHPAISRWKSTSGSEELSISLRCASGCTPPLRTSSQYRGASAAGQMNHFAAFISEVCARIQRKKTALWQLPRGGARI